MRLREFVLKMKYLLISSASGTPGKVDINNQFYTYSEIVCTCSIYIVSYHFELDGRGSESDITLILTVLLLVPILHLHE